VLYRLGVVVVVGFEMKKPQDRLMTVADVISEMGISRSTWQKLVTENQTPPIVRIGAVQRIRRDAFEAWLGQHENAATKNT
jgi:excisionase family DNA binding protein